VKVLSRLAYFKKQQERYTANRNAMSSLAGISSDASKPHKKATRGISAANAERIRIVHTRMSEA
jgi:hypothetical protein